MCLLVVTSLCVYTRFDIYFAVYIKACENRVGWVVCGELSVVMCVCVCVWLPI